MNMAPTIATTNHPDLCLIMCPFRSIDKGASGRLLHLRPTRASQQRYTPTRFRGAPGVERRKERRLANDRMHVRSPATVGADGGGAIVRRGEIVNTTAAKLCADYLRFISIIRSDRRR